MSSRPGRPESPIDPHEGPLQKFAYELRIVRQQCGSPSFQELAKHSRQLGTPYSPTTLRNAASGTVLPTTEVTDGFLRACLRYARHNSRQLANRDVLAWDVDELAAQWCQRRDDLAQLLRPTEAAAPPALEDEPAQEATAEPTATTAVIQEPMAERARSGRWLALAAASIAGAVAAGVTIAIIWNAVPANPALGTGTPSATPSQAAPVPDPTSYPRCGRFIEDKHVPVQMKPCIAQAEGSLRISAELMSTSDTPGHVYAYVWLYDPKAKYIAAETLQVCDLTFAGADQAQECFKTVRPAQDRPGDYNVAVSVQDEHTSTPKLWEAFPSYTGTQAGPMTWPPTTTVTPGG